MKIDSVARYAVFSVVLLALLFLPLSGQEKTPKAAGWESVPSILKRIVPFSFQRRNLMSRRSVPLANDNRRPGRYQVTFEAGKLTSGVYVYTLSTQSMAKVWPASSVTSKK